jgi:metal-sulfur cluster biosynthetic enzyme
VTESHAELRARITEVLDSVIDPCSGVAGVPAGLRDMGLVKGVAISPEAEGARVEVRLRLTHPSCIMGPLFIESVEHGLLELPGVASARVSIDTDYSWSEEAMEPAYRERLAAHRARVRAAREPTAEAAT